MKLRGFLSIVCDTMLRTLNITRPECLTKSNISKNTKRNSNMYGFTLIEIVIAIAISAMLSYSLFFVFYQVQKSVNVVERLISNDSAILIFQNQFEKDITGAFIPQHWFLEEQKSLPSGLKEQKPQQQQQQKIEKVFSVETDKNIITNITFITCNPLQTYDNYKPRVVRVEYQLKPAENDSYILSRKESLELDIKKFKDTKDASFDLLARIKEFSFVFIYPVEKEQQGSRDKKKKDIELKEAISWPLKEDKDAKTKLPLMPKFIKLKIVLFDINYQREDTFEFMYQVYAFTEPAQEPKKELSQPNAAPAQQNATQQIVNTPTPNVMQKVNDKRPSLLRI